MRKKGDGRKKTFDARRNGPEEKERNYDARKRLQDLPPSFSS